MKITDNILMIVAGYSLYILIVAISTRYFAEIHHLIPNIFSESVSINIGQTFHHVMGSIITGLLLIRFGSMPILLAFLIGVVVNIESYRIIMMDNSAKAVSDYYLANPTAFVNLVKPIIMLPLITYLLSLIGRIEPSEEHSSG